jgi:hypothetical protein
MDKIKKALDKEVEELKRKHKKVTNEQFARGDILYGKAWTTVYEAQINSYNRILKALEEESGEST